MEELDTVGARLRFARELRKLSGTELADRVKRMGGQLSKSSISELETGISKLPNSLNLICICSVLRIRQEWLVTGLGPMEREDYTAEIHALASRLMAIDSGATRRDIVTTVMGLIKMYERSEYGSFVEFLESITPKTIPAAHKSRLKS